jgi:Helitron helicase-like domain at N-terminus
MVSLSAKRVYHAGNGPPVFTVQGELRHLHGSILPPDGEAPAFAQVYFVSDQEALDFRMAGAHTYAPSVKREVMEILQDTLYRNHFYIQTYKTAYERIREDPNVPERCFRLQVKEGTDHRRYNLPTANEVAIILPGSGTEEVSSRDLIVFERDGNLRRISELHPAYLPLYYVLLFPYGEHGWTINIPHTNIETGEPVDAGRHGHTTVTQLEYYAFRLHSRPSDKESDHIFRARGLFQRLIVDAWAQIDQQRLSYLRHNQKKLRAEVYSGVVDAVLNGDANLQNIGTRMILPSSYLGGSRAMFQLYQDSIAIARRFSRPDLFLTITCNPNSKEIKDELLPGQQPSDRPDLIARVFREKLRKVLKMIEKGVFGKCRGFVYTIEFQKRGLPHIHILIFLDEECRIRDPRSLDSLISAQLPNPQTHPRLYELVGT